jgi:hypothetical protein
MYLEKKECTSIIIFCRNSHLAVGGSLLSVVYGISFNYERILSPWNLVMEKHENWIVQKSEAHIRGRVNKHW